jgi:hypothetical protein
MENMTKSDMLTKIDKMSDDDVIASICKITHRRYNCQASTARTMLKEFVEKSNAVEKKNDVELAPKPTAIDAKKQAQATKKAVESTKKVETKKKVETNVSTKSDKLCICNVYAIYTDRTGTVHERHISTTKDVESAKACVLNAHKEYTRTMSKDDPKPQMVSNRAEAYKKFTDTRTMYKTVAYCVESVEL